MYDKQFERELTRFRAVQMRLEWECVQMPRYVPVGHIGAMDADMAGLSIKNSPPLIESGDKWHHVLATVLLLVKKYVYEQAIKDTDAEEAASLCTAEYISENFDVLISEWGNVYCARKEK